MRKREARRKVLIRGRMRFGTEWKDICIGNVSSGGLLIQSPAAVARGTYVEVRRGHHTIIGRVAWAKEREFGLQSQERLDVESIIAAPDQRVLDFRRAVGADRCVDRRSRPRAAAPAESFDRSRWKARAGEFACLAGLAIAAVAFLTDVASQTLRQPLGVASDAMLSH